MGATNSKDLTDRAVLLESGSKGESGAAAFIVRLFLDALDAQGQLSPVIRYPLPVPYGKNVKGPDSRKVN